METTAIYKGHTDVIDGVSQATGQQWRKVTAVFETTGDYPKTIAFVAMNATCQRVLELQAGKPYKINFVLSSREYNGKWYTDAKAWAINDAAGDDAPANPIQAPPQQRPVQTSMFNQPEPCNVVAFAADGGDLPF